MWLTPMVRGDVEAVGVGQRQVEAVHQRVQHEDAEHDATGAIIA